MMDENLKTKYIFQQESEIIQELLTFFNRNQKNDIITEEKLHEFFYNIFKIEVQDMGREPYLTDKTIIDEEHKSRVYLSFESNYSRNAGNRYTLVTSRFGKRTICCN